MWLAAGIAGFAVLIGVTTWIVAYGQLGLRGTDLAIWVGLGSGVGGIVATIFGEPLFSEGLRLRREPPTAPLEPGELDKWRRFVKSSALNKRTDGSWSQLNQMLRGGRVMDLNTTGKLEIQSGREGRAHVRSAGPHQPFSALVEQWDREGERLVILGDPGYGKTFAALTLISHINHSSERIAELFPLIDWHNWHGNEDTPKSIEDWLAFQLCQSYPELLPQAAVELVASDVLVPVFDGLDEIPAAHRVSCRDALQAFARRTAPHRSFVVTCRQDEYLALGPKWVGSDRLHALVGLSQSEIESMLRASIAEPSRWAPVFESLEERDVKVLALLRSPLRLVSAIEVYERRDPDDLIALAHHDGSEAKLWDLLLRVDRHAYQHTKRGEVRSWLAFLAAGMKSHGRQQFRLHELYLYTSPQDRRRFHKLAIGLYTAALATPLLLIPGLGLKLFAACLVALHVYGYMRGRDKPMEHTVRSKTHPYSYLKAIPGSLLSGVAVGIAWTVGSAPIWMVAFCLVFLVEGASIDAVEAARISIDIAARSGLLIGAITAVIGIIEVGSEVVAEDPPEHLVGRGPGAVIRGTLVDALICAGVAGVLVGVPVSLLAWGDLWTLVAPFFIVSMAWTMGLDAWAFYHWTRLRLARAGLLPRRLRQFLDWVADEPGWLRASDAYEFRHRELLEFLAGEAHAIGADNVSWTESLIASGRHDPQALAHSQRGDELIDEGEYIAARDAYLEAIRISPQDPQFQVDLARAYGHLRQHDLQVEAARAAVDIDPMDAVNHCALSVALERRGDPLRAVEHAQLAAEIEPRLPLHQKNLAIILNNLGRDDEALAVVHAAIAAKVEKASSLASVRDSIERNRSHLNKALGQAQRMITADPEDPTGHWQEAIVLRGFGNPAEADAARMRAVGLACEGSTQYPQLAWQLALRGFSADAEAVALATASAEDDPVRLVSLACAYTDLGRPDEAERQIALARDAWKEPDELQLLATALIGAGQPAEALAAIEEALTAAPRSPVYLFTRSDAHLVAGEFDAAANAISSALENEPNGPKEIGDPAWHCRLAWRHVDPDSLEAAVGALTRAYETHDAGGYLHWGISQGTPTSPDQTQRDRLPLDAWCAAWTARGMKRHVGIVRVLLGGNGTQPIAAPG